MQAKMNRPWLECDDLETFAGGKIKNQKQREALALFDRGKILIIFGCGFANK